LTTKKCIHALDASSLGEAGGSHVDGSFDVGSVADLSVPVDIGPAERVGVDAIVAVDSGLETGQGFDSQISVDIALPDAPVGPEVKSPDVALPDLLTDLPTDLPIGKDVPVAVDAGVDASAVVVDTRPAGSPLGATCATSSDCALGNCADGVCCDSPCTGACQSCALVTSLGKCSNVTGAPAPGHTPCAGSSICAGSCNGQSASCSYRGSETNCGVASCTNGMATDPRECNGGGSCTSAQTHACGVFACGASACLTSCTDNSQCVSGAACVSGQCTMCSTGQTACPNLCVNLQTSSAHCGSCSGTGSVCSANQQCSGGQCLLADGQPCSSAGQCLSGVCPQFYLDADGDGYPVQASSKGYCNITAAPGVMYMPARSDGKWDCCDSDLTVNPGVTDFFTNPNATCGWDWNCSGAIEKEPIDIVSCGPDPTNTSCVSSTTLGTPSGDCGGSYGIPSCVQISPSPLTCGLGGGRGGTVQCH
jgi:hypothetical protein